MRPLVPQSETLFEGVGLVYQFVVDDKGVATAVVEITVIGPITYTRLKCSQGGNVLHEDHRRRPDPHGVQPCASRPRRRQPRPPPGARSSR